MEKILLDTDIGGDIDDAICLAYLLKEPQCKLLGITTVCGEPEKRAAVANAICKAAGADIPIVAGTDSTLQPIPLYPTPDGACALERWQHDTFEKADAPAFLYEKIKENPHEVVLIGIGNMTNIAMLFQSYPDACDLLKGLYVMNGYFGLEKLPDPYYNWNSWADPLASKIVFSSRINIHRTIPLEVTDMLTIAAEQAGAILRPDSDLMAAVFDFGNAWLQSAGKLTLHDPLAAVTIFHPDICKFERGFVQVETVQASNMGGTSFTPSAEGNVEIARTVDKERFYRILSRTLNAGIFTPNRHYIPPLVVSRAKSTGGRGKTWLHTLDSTISDLEKQWDISVSSSLSGGTHAFVAYADGKNSERYVLKIDMPEDLGGEFENSIIALKAVDGHGYARLIAYDFEKKASLLERLGKPISTLSYSVNEQLRLICSALQKSWKVPAENLGLPTGIDSITWFREFIGETWERLNRPCSQQVISQAFDYLKARENAIDPAEFVLLHGDAHGNNTLQDLSGENTFKLVDPDGIFYEKAYDLGVLMREWTEEYDKEPLRKGLERCEYLHTLTGVPAQAIWEWGFLQTVSTSFVLLQIGQEEHGHAMLKVAESWKQTPLFITL